MFGQKKVCSCCKQKYATHFYKEVINGHSVEVSLCDDCAKKFDFADHYNVFLSSLMNDLFELGLMGGDDSVFKRRTLENRLHIDQVNGKTLLKRLKALGLERKDLEEALGHE